MAGLFDFEHYYTEKVAKAEIKLDVSGLPMKSSASSSTESDDGTIEEADMNEYVTNNVMYKISSVITNIGTEVSHGERVMLSVTDVDGGSPETIYFLVGDPIDELVSAGVYEIPETRALIMPFLLAVGTTYFDSKVLTGIQILSNESTVGTSVSSIAVTVIPRLRWENPTLSLFNINPSPTSAEYNSVNQNFWHMQYLPNYIPQMLAGVGLLGDMFKGFKWYDNQKRGNSSIVRSYDSFVKTINSLGDRAKENGLGIKVTFYDDSYANKVEWPDGMSKSEYNRRCKDADYTSTEIKRGDKVTKIYPERLNEFLAKCGSHVDETGNPDNPVLDISGDNITAIIPNISDVFKKLYYPKDELAQDFSDKFFDTYNSIMSIRGVRSFMSSSLKRKLDANKLKLKKFATEGRTRFAVDLSSCVNYLSAMYSRNTPWLSYGITYNDMNNSNLINLCGIRSFGDTGFENKYVYGPVIYNATGGVEPNDANQHYGFVSYQNIGAISPEDLSSNLPFWGGRCHNMSLHGRQYYSDWRIATKKMKISDVKQQLADNYATMYNNEHDLSEGDAGYIVRCEYVTEGEVGFFMTVTTSLGDMRRHVNDQYIPGDFSPNAIPTVDQLVAMASGASFQYGGSVKNYADVCLTLISMLVARDDSPDSVINGISGKLIAPRNFGDNEEIDVMEWDSASTPGKIIGEWEFEPSYETIDNIGEATTYTISDCIDFALDVMDEAIDEIDDILTVQGLTLGPTFLLIQKLRLRETKEFYADFKDVMKKIQWYQVYTNESVFDNKCIIGNRTASGVDEYYALYRFCPARFLVPVSMYKKVRVKYKRWGRTRHKMVKRSIGVRWAEVTFVDNDVYESYPQNSNEPMQFYPIGKNASVSYNANGTAKFTFESSLEGDTTDLLDVGAVSSFNQGTLVLTNADGMYVNVAYEGSTVFDSTEAVPLNGITSVFVYGIYVPLDNTQKSDERTKVRIEYKMPYIPYDTELRRWAFINYGAFDQDIYASNSREVPANPEDKTPGWQIFHNSSKRIGDLRASMGIYDAVAILMGILRNTFGASCVELAETMRSKADQDLMCTGGGESTFLSWHNYGLAVKILINDPKTGMPIEDGSDAMMKLIDVAEAFTNACFNGAFGKPLNVVWCGRLKIGANNFVWEFLPIGVDHKDAMQFREALLNQEDPVASLGYVNVDKEKMVYRTKPKEKVPYVLLSSEALKNAIVINGDHYVSPRLIRNYTTPKDLVLINIMEFCNLIRTKMEANGSSLNDRASMYEWKTLNDKAYKQLLIYYGLTGSLSAAKALVCGEYVETYKDIVERKYSEDIVEMVREFLGNLYADAKIYIEESGDGGAWLSLSDGKLHLKCTELHSVYTQNSKDNFFGEKQAPMENMARGLYVDGVFRTEDELVDMGYQIETVSEVSYIDGYDNNGNVTGDDALYMHSMVATQIKEEFDKLKELFENYGGGIMYDHFVDGPNASMEDMVENEFGIISGQDLIDFDNLRAIFNQKRIEDNAKRNSDGTIQGAGGDADGTGVSEVFEKVVSNAELSGVRKASLTKEHIKVTIQPNNMSTEELYRKIMKGSMTQANDMFRK